MPDNAERQIAEWLATRGHRVAAVVPLAGDVSPRRYARVELSGGERKIVARYPERQLDDCRRFATTTDLFASAGLPVPAVDEIDCDAGWMLLEDVGRRTLYDLADRPWQELASYLHEADRLGRRIAELPAAEVAALCPTLDEALLRRELDQTWELFLLPRRLTGGEELTQALRLGLDTLCARLGREPTAPCHRDYMARNLVPRGASPGLVVLDHQDLRLGPRYYDLASLLNDSLFAPPDVEEEIVAASCPTPEARLGYHRAAAQRTLKAVGTFAAFSQRGSDRHLPLVPPTLARALHHLGQLPETTVLAAPLTDAWRPVLNP